MYYSRGKGAKFLFLKAKYDEYYKSHHHSRNIVHGSERHKVIRRKAEEHQHNSDNVTKGFKVTHPEWTVVMDERLRLSRQRMQKE